MVENAPEVEEVLRKFHDWTGDAMLVAHNASFDMGFLNTGYQKMGMEKLKIQSSIHWNWRDSYIRNLKIIV